MMKKSIRFIALFLSLVLFVSLPVSADDSVSPWVNILDMAPNSFDADRISFSSSGNLSYYLSQMVSIRHLQGLVQCSNSSLTGISYSLTLNGTKYPLTILDVGNGLYRFYSDAIAVDTNSIFLHFTNNGSAATVQVISFQYSSLRSWSYAEIGSMTIGSSPTYTMASTNSSVMHKWPASSSGPYIIHLTCSDWKLYDSIDFFVYGYGIDVNSIVGRFGSFAVPVTVSHLEAGGNWNEPRFSAMITLDLTGVDRSKTDVPEVEISGVRRTTDEEFYLSLLSVTGSIHVDSELNSDLSFFNMLKLYFRELHSNLIAKLDSNFDELGMWSKSIYLQFVTFSTDILDKLTSGFEAIDDRFNTLTLTMVDLFNQFLHQDTSGSEQFEEDVASQATEFEDIAETIDDVTKPPVDDLDPSVDDLVSPSDVQSYTSVLGVLLGNQIFLSVCLMSLTFALVSYTIYGKR